VQHRELGTQGLRVSALGLGTMGQTFTSTASDEQQRAATIRRAHELGIDFFDTAEIYGFGTGSSEILLGNALKEVRDEVVLATKFGFDMKVEPMGSASNSRPENIRAALENSLRYLQTDRVDLYYQHIADPAVPVEEVAGVIGELIAEGKVLYFGLSNVGPQYVRRAHAVTPVTALQYEYSIFEREVESTLPVLRELGIGLVPWSPLGKGFLTGDVKPASEYPADDMRGFDDRWQGQNYDVNLRAVQQLKELAAEKGITAAQLALAWLLAQGEDIVPIPATRSAARLAENVAAVDVRLEADDLTRIREILPEGSAGDRVPAAMAERMPA
jgi:aryl-alcohol dehydrogenase-like predicted oxidoreductase